jgi:2'-hydroxyisoflavone reductase
VPRTVPAVSSARAPAPVRLLLLGGTSFLGPAVVRCARERGHEVTLFHRGRTNPGLFPELESLRGDRNGDVSALAGRTFDAVIDTCAYRPVHVERIAEVLGPHVPSYVLVSTLSVYPGLGASRSSRGPCRRR